MFVPTVVKMLGCDLCFAIAAVEAEVIFYLFKGGIVFERDDVSFGGRASTGFAGCLRLAGQDVAFEALCVCV